MTVGRPPGSGSPFNTSEKDGRASGDLPAAALYSMLPRLPRREGSRRVSRLLRGPRTWARMSRRPGGTRGAGAPAAGPQEGLISHREVGGTPGLGDSLCLELVGSPCRHLHKGQARKTHHRELFLGKLSQRAGLIDAHPSPGRPQRGFGNTCLATVDPRQPTGVSPFLSSESRFLLII